MLLKRGSWDGTGSGGPGGQAGNWMEKCPPLSDSHLLRFYKNEETFWG